MKVSQFIKILQRLEYEHGDIAIINTDNYSPKAEYIVLDVIGPVIMIKWIVKSMEVILSHLR